MEEETLMMEKIEKTVREILRESDITGTSEFRVRKLASERLGIDLSEEKSYKAKVRSVVNSFIDELQAKSAASMKEKEDEVRACKQFDDNGDLIVCRLAEKRRVTIQEFKGKKLVSIREYYNKDGKELPTFKGISLTDDQWLTFKNHIPAIEEAVKKMESRV